MYVSTSLPTVGKTPLDDCFLAIHLVESCTCCESIVTKSEAREYNLTTNAVNLHNECNNHVIEWRETLACQMSLNVRDKL